jgi:hypothetical protein
MGQGLPWGTKQYLTSDSVDARLFGCACCGMKEYDSSDNLAKKKKYRIVPVELLNSLKLSNKDFYEYEENLKVKLMLPIKWLLLYFYTLES